MTDIPFERGGKKAIAWSLEWPGWCRIRASQETALQALIETEARSRFMAQRAGLDFAPMAWHMADHLWEIEDHRS